MQCLQTGRRCFTNKGGKPAGPRLAVGCVGGVGLKQTFTLLGVVSQWPLADVRSNVLDVRFRRQCGRRVSYWPTSASTVLRLQSTASLPQDRRYGILR
jgi:hypothetical protein